MRRPRLVRELYQDRFPDPYAKILPGGGLRFSVFPDDPLLELAERFDGPRLGALIRNPVRDDLKGLMAELCLNSFRHGDARVCTLEVYQSVVAFIDDGQLFDPTAAPEATWGAGLRFVSLFLKKYRGKLVVEHRAHANNGNEVILTFADDLTSPALAEDCVVRVTCPPRLYLNFAEHLARLAYIPPGCDTLRFYVSPGFFNPSSLVIFIRAILNRIPPPAKLEVVFAEGDNLVREVVVEVFRGERVVVA